MISKSHSESLTRIEYQEISHSWRIENFSMCRKKIKEFIESEDFPKEDKVQWRLQLFPNGLNEESKDFISIFLKFTPKENESIIAQSKLSLSNTIGKVFENSEYITDEYEENSTRCYNEFIKRNDIMPHLKDDILIVNCSVKWVVDITNVHNRSSSLSEHDVRENLSNNLYNLMTKGSFTDVCLLIKNGPGFCVHKFMLAARSPVFAAMFEHNMKENKESVVKINNMNAEVLKAMLKFIYSGKFEVDYCKIEGLLAAADKYAIKDLKTLCELELSKQLNIENVVRYLLLADKYNAEMLKGQVGEFISTNLRDVLKTEAIKKLTVAQKAIFHDVLQSAVEKL